MKKIPKKKQHILDAAQKLFWKHGIKRISLEALCSKADVSKMTFYKYFENKNKLIEFILQELIDKARLDYNAIIGKI